MAEETTGRTKWDYFNKRPRVLVAIIVALIFVLIGAIYIINKDGVLIETDKFKLSIGGTLDTMSKTEGSMINLREIANQVANNTKDPRVKNEFMKISGEATQVIDKTANLRARLLAFNQPPDPVLQEELIKEVLENFGVSRDIIQKMDLGIVNKYIGSDVLRKKLESVTQESLDKDNKIRQLENDKRRLEDDKKQLQRELLDLNNKMAMERANYERPNTIDLARADSIRRLLHDNDSINRENEVTKNKLSNVLPFLIENGSAELTNVGKKRTGEYKIMQLKGNDKTVQLFLDPKINASYVGKSIPPYDLQVEINYTPKGIKPLRKESFTITIHPGKPITKSFALERNIGRGKAFVYVYYEKKLVWKSDFAVGSE